MAVTTPTLPRALTSSSRYPRNLIILLGVFAVTYLPFITKPLQTDEPVYVWVARHITQNPIDFYGFNLNWEGHDQRVSQFCENPPLFSYFLAIASKLVGWSDIGLRLSILPIDLLTIVGAWRLAAGFCRRPSLAIAIMFCCPAFLLSENTLMCEPLSTCLWVWVVYCWVRGSTDSPRLLPLAGLLAGAAILAKYSCLCLIPLLAAFSLLNPANRPARFLQAISLTLPVLILIAYEAYTTHVYGSGALLAAGQYVAGSHASLRTPILIRVINTAAFVGGGGAGLALVSLLLLRRGLLLGLVFATTALGSGAAHYLLPPPGWVSYPSAGALTGGNASFAASFGFYIQNAIFLMGGLVVAIVCIRSIIRRPPDDRWRGNLFLLLWVGGVFVFTACINWAINARSILPMILPAAILVVRAVEQCVEFPGRRVGLALAVGGVLSLAVVNADAGLASAIKSAADTLARLDASQTIPTSTLLFAGHGGFQYYLQATGAKPLDSENPKLHVGDIAIFPHNSYGASPGGQNFKALGIYTSDKHPWLATTQSDMGAGFYCSYGYALPYVFGPIPPESFSILQVTPETRIRP